MNLVYKSKLSNVQDKSYRQVTHIERDTWQVEIIINNY